LSDEIGRKCSRTTPSNSWMRSMESLRTPHFTLNAIQHASNPSRRSLRHKVTLISKRYQLRPSRPCQRNHCQRPMRDTMTSPSSVAPRGLPQQAPTAIPAWDEVFGVRATVRYPSEKTAASRMIVISFSRILRRRNDLHADSPWSPQVYPRNFFRERVDKATDN
jgi:hypothetical protein